MDYTSIAQPWVHRVWARKTHPLLISACFGLAHIAGTPGGIVGMVFAGLFGLAMCVVRALSGGTVVWCVGVHVVADIILIGEVYGAFV